MIRQDEYFRKNYQVIMRGNEKDSIFEDRNDNNEIFGARAGKGRQKNRPLACLACLPV
jgi:hypothetical protein